MPALALRECACVFKCVCAYLCMPDSTVLALVFEVIMSQRHWVKTLLHTQHIYINVRLSLFVCAYVFILHYVCHVLHVFDRVSLSLCMCISLPVVQSVFTYCICFTSQGL